MSAYEIELNSEYPNQEFDVFFEEISNSIHVLLQDIEGVTFMSTFINGEQVGQAFNCCANQYIIPYQYMVEQLGGNFVFITDNDNYPNWENYNTTCKLYFVTQDELNSNA